MPNNLSQDQITWFKETHGVDIKSFPTNQESCWLKERNLFIKKVLGLPDDFWEMYWCNARGVYMSGRRLETAAAYEYDGYGDTYHTFMLHIKDSLFVNNISSRFKDMMKVSISEVKNLYDDHEPLIEILSKFDVDGMDILMDLYIEIHKRPWQNQHDGRSNIKAALKENNLTLEHLEEKIINNVFNKLEGWFIKNPFPNVNYDITNTFEEGSVDTCSSDDESSCEDEITSPTLESDESSNENC